ncbi:hypothetical protein ACFL0B_07105, partial [Thermodesulfobacteriota bacterium]
MSTISKPFSASSLRTVSARSQSLFLLCLPPGLPHPKVAAYLSDMEERFCGALANDINMSRALGALFDFMKKINPILSEGKLDLE